MAAGDYLAHLERGELRDEVRAFAAHLTVAETYFFRNPTQFEAFRALAHRHMTQPDTGARPLRVLSAGCASGEETYSLAIAAREVFAGSRCSARVVGVDINPQVLERARRARYSEWSLRAVAPDVRARWLRTRGAETTLDPSIHGAVEFIEGNLAQPDRELFGDGRWDVIFCRNVLMYFSPERARAALANLTRALAPHGHLFLGHAETLRGLSHDFHLCHTHDAFYYQRKQPDSSPLAALPLPLTAAPTDASHGALDWFADIDRATARVRDLGLARAAVPEVARAAGDLGAVLELMQHDRHSEALALLSATHGAPTSDPDQLLVEATLLIHGNHFAAAEAVCERLLRVDELSAGAHYVLALCREAAGDVERALHLDEVAAYLDPDFAMPHLHMGLLLRRTGEPEAARRALAQARALLAREDTARLAMFGGGFGRSALLALCSAEAPAQGEPS
jgi:chemotaxis protein methyltransferase CheR